MADLSSRLLEAAHDPLTPDSMVPLLEEAARALSPAPVLMMPSRERMRERIAADPDVEDCGAVPASTAAPLRRVRHVRRGSEYEVLGEAEGQVSVKGAVILEEGDRVVVYRGADGRLWWRVPEEFSDGRFVDI